MSVKGVLFDFDGTLTAPGAIDFSAIRKLLGCPDHMPILEFICLLKETEQETSLALLNRFEHQAALESIPAPGSIDLLLFLGRKNIPAGILTRNSLNSVLTALKRFKGIKPGDFAVILTRDDDIPPKPHPAGVKAAAQRMGIKPSELLFVGDFSFDILAGNSAGAKTALFSRDHLPLNCSCLRPDYIISSIRELIPIICPCDSEGLPPVSNL